MTRDLSETAPAVRLKRRLTWRYACALGAFVALLVGTWVIGFGHIDGVRRELDEIEAVTHDRALANQLVRFAGRLADGAPPEAVRDELRRALARHAALDTRSLCSECPLIIEAAALVTAARELVESADPIAAAELAQQASALIVRQRARLDGDRREARDELEQLAQVGVVLLVAWLLLLAVEVAFVFLPGLRLIARHIDDYLRARRLERQLKSARRMRILGRMAGGMAHEFNNILMPIVGLSDLLRERMAADSPDRMLLDMLVEAGDRARRLVARVRVLDRPLVFAEVDMVELIEGAIEQCGDLAGVERIERVVAPEARRLQADAGALALAIVEALRNALAAIDADGRVEIAVGCEAAADAVFIRVTDDGHGMSPGVREAAFDPFFTTREAGGGVGLGLSVAHGIVSAHNGRIELQSAEGRGAVVTLYIPRDLTSAGEEA